MRPIRVWAGVGVGFGKPVVLYCEPEEAFVPLLGVVERVTFTGIGIVDVTRPYRSDSRSAVSGSFKEFYRRQWRFTATRRTHAVGLGFVLTGDRWVAEELAQEGFAAACRSVSRLRRRGVERRAKFP